MIEDDFNYLFEPRQKLPLIPIWEVIQIYADISEFLFSLPEIPFDPRRPSKTFYIIPSSQQLIDSYLAKIEEVPWVYKDYCTPYPTSDKDYEIPLIRLNLMSI